MRVVGANITYQVTLNPAACHEVHVGKFTVPSDLPPDIVSTDYFDYKIRPGGESVIFIAAAYGAAAYGVPAGQRLTPEKYAVDLSRPKSFRRLSETEWQSGMELKWSDQRGVDPSSPGSRGVQYLRSPVLEKSGPKRAGLGRPGLPLKARFSVNMTRAAVNSWDGFDLVNNPLEFSWHRNKVEGDYWVDIYEVASATPLVRFNGAFKKSQPYQFQGHASWYADRYYVMPMGKFLEPGWRVGMERLLVCDADAAARKIEGSLRERK